MMKQILQIVILLSLAVIGQRVKSQKVEIIPEIGTTISPYKPTIAMQLGVVGGRQSGKTFQGYGLLYSTDYGVGKNIVTLFGTAKVTMPKIINKIPLFVEGRIGPSLNFNEYQFPIGGYVSIAIEANLKDVIKFPLYAALTMDYRYSYYKEENAELQTTATQHYHGLLFGIKAAVKISEILK